MVDLVAVQLLVISTKGARGSTKGLKEVALRG
jgi:hypothetical protein